MPSWFKNSSLKPLLLLCQSYDIFLQGRLLLTIVLTPDCIAHFMLLLMACFHQCPRLTGFSLQPSCVCVLSTTLFYSEVAIIEELYWNAVSRKVNSAFAAALILFPFSCTWEFVLSPLVAEGNEVQ